MNTSETAIATTEPTEIAIRQPDSLLNIIASAAENPLVDVGKLQALLCMSMQVRAEDARLAFSKAMAECQNEMVSVVRDATNSHTRSKYARLETIDAKVRPIYSRHGFSLSFNSQPSTNSLKITCAVRHSGGHCEEYQLEGALDGGGMRGNENKTPIQALGSTASYLRRYLTCLVFNITLTNEDNDGNRTGPATPLTDNERLDQMEKTLGNDAPPPPSKGKMKTGAPDANPEMVTFVIQTEALYAKVKTMKALFALGDEIKDRQAWMKVRAPDLSDRLTKAAMAASDRINGEDANQEPAK